MTRPSFGGRWHHPQRPPACARLDGTRMRINEFTLQGGEKAPAAA
jgi:hypothetical protein